MTTYLKNNPPLFDFDFGLRLKSPKSPQYKTVRKNGIIVGNETDSHRYA